MAVPGWVPFRLRVCGRETSGLPDVCQASVSCMDHRVGVSGTGPARGWSNSDQAYGRGTTSVCVAGALRMAIPMNNELKSALDSLRKAADAVADRVLGTEVTGHLRDATRSGLRAAKASLDKAERNLDRDRSCHGGQHDRRHNSHGGHRDSHSGSDSHSGDSHSPSGHHDSHGDSDSGQRDSDHKPAG